MQKINHLASENKSSDAAKKKKKNYVEEFGDQMILHKRDRAVKVRQSQTCFQSIFRSNILSKIGVPTKEKSKNKKVITVIAGVEDKPFSEDLGMKEQENIISEKSETNLNEGMLGDNLSDDFKRRNKEIKDFPFEHADLELLEFSSSEKKSSVVENIQKVVPDPHEKAYAKNGSRINTNEQNFMSKQRTAASKQSDTIDPDIDSKNINDIEKHAGVITSETEKRVNENYQEKTIRRDFTIPLIIRKVFDWSLDETFYTGVIQSGSFINKLSKALTG